MHLAGLELAATTPDKPAIHIQSTLPTKSVRAQNEIDLDFGWFEEPECPLCEESALECMCVTLINLIEAASCVPVASWSTKSLLEVPEYSGPVPGLQQAAQFHSRIVSGRNFGPANASQRPCSSSKCF